MTKVKFFFDSSPEDRYAKYHGNLAIAFYIAGASALSLFCVNMLKKTHETDLDEDTVATVA